MCKNGEVSYARARHLSADKKFYYHQQSVEYTNRKLRELGIDLTIEPCQASKSKSIEQTNIESGSKLESGWSWGWELNPYITALQAVA
jgi:hypothetical protein